MTEGGKKRGKKFLVGRFVVVSRSPSLEVKKKMFIHTFSPSPRCDFFFFLSCLSTSLDLEKVSLSWRDAFVSTNEHCKVFDVFGIVVR